MLRTHSSNLAMSVSSSQGFTSSKIDDLATTAGSEERKRKETSYQQLGNFQEAQEYTCKTNFTRQTLPA